MTSYLIAGGGTAGHVNPMLAIADEIRKREPSSAIIMIGTKEGLESRLVPARGYDLHTIAKLPFPRSLNKRAFTFVTGWNRAVKDVQRVIADRRVDVVIGVGGYASAPAYVAARRSRTPLVIHEANAKPGLANRLAARWTRFVGVAFEGTRLPHARVVGMPIRAEIAHLDRPGLRQLARENYGFNNVDPVLLVTGGSLGARRLNSVVREVLPTLLRAGIQVLHITGEQGGAAESVPGYVSLPYCDDMTMPFSAADAVVARAGASTVSEVSALGIPAVFVPYAVGNGEQTLNARQAVASGGAFLVADSDFSGEWLQHHIIPMVSSVKKLHAMAEAMAQTGTRHGSELTVNLIQEALASRETSVS